MLESGNYSDITGLKTRSLRRLRSTHLIPTYSNRIDFKLNFSLGDDYPITNIWINEYNENKELVKTSEHSRRLPLLSYTIDNPFFSIVLLNSSGDVDYSKQEYDNILSITFYYNSIEKEKYYNYNIECERGSLSNSTGLTSWSMEDHLSNIRSKYMIACDGATKGILTIPDILINNFTTANFYFYDNTYSFLSETIESYNENIIFNIPNNAKFFRIALKEIINDLPILSPVLQISLNF